MNESYLDPDHWVNGGDNESFWMGEPETGLPSTEIILLEAEREIDRLRDEVTRVRKQLHEAMLLLDSSEPGRDIYVDVESRGRWKLRRDKLLRSLQLMSSP